MTMPILTAFCAFELLAAAAVIPSIAMIREIHLLNMAVLRWVVGAVSRGADILKVWVSLNCR
jgi:hypothetical protein